jgi:RimJ/RimL family protein N-acetyltransferase
MLTPEPVTLDGHGVRLEPLAPGHVDALVAAAADGEQWKRWYVSVADLEPGREHLYMNTALTGRDDGHMLPWSVRERTTGMIVGSTRLHDIAPSIDRVEVGYTFYAGRWQRTHVNTACKLLLLSHAFDSLGCRVVGFKVDTLNERSQRAVEALGAIRDGIIYHDGRRRDGSRRDTHVYSILVSEWPAVRERLGRRLVQGQKKPGA